MLLDNRDTVRLRAVALRLQPQAIFGDVTAEFLQITKKTHASINHHFCPLSISISPLPGHVVNGTCDGVSDSTWEKSACIERS